MDMRANFASYLQIFVNSVNATGRSCVCLSRKAFDKPNPLEYGGGSELALFG